MSKPTRITVRPIKVGNEYPFYSTAQTSVTKAGVLIRNFSGCRVMVLDRHAPSDEVEQLYTVSYGGEEWDAYEGELDGYYFNTGQFYGPSNQWGKL